jgi:hypothetical protein
VTVAANVVLIATVPHVTDAPVGAREWHVHQRCFPSAGAAGAGLHGCSRRSGGTGRGCASVRGGTIALIAYVMGKVTIYFC